MSLLKSLCRLPFGSTRRPRSDAPRPRRGTRLALEPLEARILLWGRFVGYTSDESGAVALAAAVDQAGDILAGGASEAPYRFGVAKLGRTDGRVLWNNVLSQGGGEARAVTVDAAGDAVAAGAFYSAASLFVVGKFRGTDGAVLWHREFGLFSGGYAVRVDAAGDVVAAGFNEPGNFFVVKLAGADGAELWRSSVSGTGGYGSVAYALQLDASGDVVAAGRIRNVGTFDFAVVKFAGADGSLLWRQEINGTVNGSDEAHGLVLDADGNALAAGWTTNLGTGRDATVVKLSGADGSLLWRQDVNGMASRDDWFNGLALIGAGDVVAAGVTWDLGPATFTVVRFAGVDGTIEWQHDLEPYTGAAQAIVVDPAGDVVAAGGGIYINPFGVIKLAGADGQELWRNRYGTGDTSAEAVVADAAGDVIAAGQACTDASGCGFFVEKLNGADGSDYLPGGFPGGSPAPTPAIPPAAAGMPTLNVGPLDRFFGGATEVEQGLVFSRPKHQRALADLYGDWLSDTLVSDLVLAG